MEHESTGATRKHGNRWPTYGAELLVKTGYPPALTVSEPAELLLHTAYGLLRLVPEASSRMWPNHPSTQVVEDWTALAWAVAGAWSCTYGWLVILRRETPQQSRLSAKGGHRRRPRAGAGVKTVKKMITEP